MNRNKATSARLRKAELWWLSCKAACERARDYNTLIDARANKEQARKYLIKAKRLHAYPPSPQWGYTGYARPTNSIL